MSPNALDALKRAAYMLEVVAQFIDLNPVKEYEVPYDETTCDGYCLMEDCKIAADDAREAIRKATGASEVKP